LSGRATSMLGLRQAGGSDLAFLCSVRRSAMDPFLSEVGVFVSDERNEELIRWRYDCVSLITLHDGETVGYVKLIREPPKWVVAQIAVASEFQGRGIGSSVIRKILGEATSDGVAVSLSVYKNNVGALRLYEKLGFRIIGASEREHLLEWGWSFSRRPTRCSTRTHNCVDAVGIPGCAPVNANGMPLVWRE
jgi:ribosomal protein S18 acetylase RimI-like enzyme